MTMMRMMMRVWRILMIISIIKIRTLIFAPVLALSHAIRFYSHSLADIKGCGHSLIWIIKVSICKTSSTKYNL